MGGLGMVHPEFRQCLLRPIKLETNLGLVSMHVRRHRGRICPGFKISETPLCPLC
jgi:hypothetical protein